MTNRDGMPIWYELMTDAPDAAQKFYGRVMNWNFEETPGAPDREYHLCIPPNAPPLCGMVKMPDGAPFPPHWAVYFGVKDVDRAIDKLKSLGGEVHMGPQDIPGVGRFAFVADPQGASFYLMRGDSDQDSQSFDQTKAGHFGWNELVTSDQKAALKFYGDLFGWESTGSMPMNDSDDYTFFGKGDVEMIGAMMHLPEEDPRPYWNFALGVADVDKAKSAVESGGGMVTHGPIALPGDRDDWLIQASDPQGAKMMFTGPGKEGEA